MRSTRCAQSAYDCRIEELRHVEFPSLLGTTYLDHAGTTLYSSSLIDACHQDLKSNLYGNPHSDSPASDLSTQKVDGARLSVLKYFNADPDHFDVVFTANATAAIKLVADCFTAQRFWYGFHKDAHSSIVGVRELASAGSRCFTSNQDVDDWIEERTEDSNLQNLELFAYPAQSNMTGYRLPYSWSRRIRHSRSNDAGKQRTYVLLDAASYLTTGRLDLHHHEEAPDFVALSFYKIFGFPDLGALIVRKTAKEVLTSRRYFGGGTVDQITVIDSRFHAKKTATIHDFLEDGTLPFHNIVALTHAITIHQRLFGSAQAISQHTSHLSSWLYDRLSTLKHFNSAPVLRFHKERYAKYGDPETQGPILAFSISRSDSTTVGKSHFERLAIDCGFQLRTGGVCNPGGIASMLELNHWELRRNFTEGARCGGDIDVMGGKPTGIIRVSLGAMSTLGDVRRFADFVEWFFVENVPTNPSAIDPYDYQEKESIPKAIAPLEHCAPIALEKVEDFDAYRVWEKQWCIVEATSSGWKPLVPGVALEKLSCNLDPERGLLRVSHLGKPDLTVSLWDRPKQDTITTTISNVGGFDIYNNQGVAEWLSEALGFPCTLARYHGVDAKTLPQARTCATAGCDMCFATRSDLYQHYQGHAKMFLNTNSVRNEKHNEAHNHDQNRPSLAKDRRSWTKKYLTVVLSTTEIPPLLSPTSQWSQSTKVDNGQGRKRGKLRKWMGKISSIPKILGRCIV